MRAKDPRTEPIGPDGRPLSEQPRWRQDFPIDVAEDNYVSRRDFTKFLVLTSGAFAVGQITIGLQSLIGEAEVSGTKVAIAEAALVPVGGAKPFAFPGPTDACLLVRLDEATFVAFSQACTHLQCAVVPEPHNDRFYCPCHEGSFDLRTGRPLAGPPSRPLSRITLEVSNGIVYATGVEVRTV